MPREQRRVSHLEFAQLGEVAKELARVPKLYKLKEIREKFEAHLGKPVANSTLNDLCEHANLNYRGKKGMRNRMSEAKCPHCKMPISLV